MNIKTAVAMFLRCTLVFIINSKAMAVYNPATGTFIARDPAGYSHSKTTNLYSYANNDPMGNTDPLGLCSCEASGGKENKDGTCCCNGKERDPKNTCCYENEVIPQKDFKFTEYRICCRAGRYDPDEDSWIDKYTLPLIRHCHLQQGACEKGDDSYLVLKDNSCGREMENGKPCPCVTPSDIAECLQKNPYAAGSGSRYNNCQTNTVSRMKKCCLKSDTWEPNWYGTPKDWEEMPTVTQEEERE